MSANCTRTVTSAQVPPNATWEANNTIPTTQCNKRVQNVGAQNNRPVQRQRRIIHELLTYNTYLFIRYLFIPYSKYLSPNAAVTQSSLR